MKDFKFFQKKERVLIQWMDEMDDYHLGGIRRQPDETDPRYYDTDDFIFSDVSQIRFDPVSYLPYKHMMYRHIRDGDTMEGNRIYSDHPMWNFPDIL